MMRTEGTIRANTEQIAVQSTYLSATSQTSNNHRIVAHLLVQQPINLLRDSLLLRRRQHSAFNNSWFSTTLAISPHTPFSNSNPLSFNSHSHNTYTTPPTKLVRTQESPSFNKQLNTNSTQERSVALPSLVGVSLMRSFMSVSTSCALTRRTETPRSNNPWRITL